MFSVVQEICFLSQLLCIEPGALRHTLVGAKFPDPLFDLVEGHVLHRGAEWGHVAGALAGRGIERNLSCDVDNCFIVPENRKAEFEAVVSAGGFEFEWGGLPTAKTLLTFEVPENFTWIVTFIKLRSYPILTDVPLADGDFRSDDFDFLGDTKIYWQTNGQSSTPENAVHTIWMNRPVLFAFQGGVTVTLVAMRPATSQPPNPGINVSINSYLADPTVMATLNPMVTNIYASYLP